MPRGRTPLGREPLTPSGGVIGVEFNYPVLSLFDRGADLFGIPLIYAYIFAAWAGLIAIMALFIERPIE